MSHTSDRFWFRWPEKAILTLCGIIIFGAVSFTTVAVLVPETEEHATARHAWCDEQKPTGTWMDQLPGVRLPASDSRCDDGRRDFGQWLVASLTLSLISICWSAAWMFPLWLGMRFLYAIPLLFRMIGPTV